ncbi:MAG: hypothetical protein P8100_00810 [bacterium]
MKRFIILLFVLTIVFSADAQKKFDNEIYFRVGHSNPCWRQFGADRDWWPDNNNRWGLPVNSGQYSC